jgi:hypothetical protein
MRATRTTLGTLLVVSCVSLLSLGCPPPKKSVTVKKPSSSEEASSPETTKETPRQTAKQFGEEFLKAVTEGKATPDQLTVGFKKAAFPTPKFESEAKLGYSDTEAARWLKKPGNPGYNAPTETVRTKPEAYSVLTGTVKVADRTENYLLRVVKDKSTGKWKIDWFQQTTGTATPPAGDTDAAPAQDAVQGFLDNLIGGDLTLASALVSTNLKAKMASPLPSDKTPYNESHFNAQLKDRRELFKGYTLGNPKGSGNEYTFEVKAPATQPLNFKVVKDDKTGTWLVDGI